MKKLFIEALIVFFVLISLCTSAYAYDDELFRDSVDSVIDSADSETKEALNSLGFKEYTFDELYSISLSDIGSLILGFFTGALKKPAECFSGVIGMILITSVGSAYIRQDSRMSGFLETAAVLFTGFFLLGYTAEVIEKTITAVESIGVIMKILVPVIAAMAAFSGSYSLALSFNAVTVYVAEIISAVCREVLTVFLVILSCVGVCMSVNDVIKADTVSDGIKKTVNMILGFAGTVFTGFIAIKDVLASGVDKLSVKGIKFILGTAVPVVGNALSEGLSSIIASVVLMKNSIGVFGIIMITVIVLPVVCELILWMLSFSAAAYCCELFGQPRVSRVIMTLRFTTSVLLSVLLFGTYLLVISVGMILLMSGK